MKTKTIFAALLIGLAMVACAPKNAGEGEISEAPKAKTANDFKVSKAEVDSVSYLAGVNFGTWIKGNNFGDLNYAELVKGIKDFVSAKGNVNDPEFVKQFKVNPELMNELFNGYLEKRQNALLIANKEEGEKFLAANAKKEGVQVTGSGLQYKIIEPGNDVKPGPADSVWVNYKGSLLDGTVFDQTPEGSEPVMLLLNRVIPGWQEGLQLIGEGGKIQLFIPSELAYGEQANQVIGPNATLIFDVETSKVGKVAE